MSYETLEPEVLTLQPLMDWLRETPFQRQMLTYIDADDVCHVDLLQCEPDDTAFIVRKGKGNNLLAAMLGACISLGKPEEELREPFPILRPNSE